MLPSKVVKAVGGGWCWAQSRVWNWERNL